MATSQWLYLGTCFMIVISVVPRNSSSPVNSSEASGDLVAKYKNIEVQMNTAVEYIFDHVTPFVMKGSGTLNVSSQCMRQAFQLMRDLRLLKPWALKFLDSSSKTIDGVMEGTFTSFGSYDECLDIEVPSKRNEQKVLFRGQYCSINISPPLPSNKQDWEQLKRYFLNKTKDNDMLRPLHNMMDQLELEDIIGVEVSSGLPRIGICVPSGCTVKDVNNVAHIASKAANIDLTVSACDQKRKIQFSAVQIFALCFFSTLGFLVLSGTSLELHFKHRNIYSKNKFSKALQGFSLVTNVQHLLNTSNDQKELKFFNGMRFITMIWIIYGHNFIHLNLRVLTSLKRFVDIRNSLASQIIANPTFSVDTFFFLGGFFVCYNVVKNAKSRKHEFNYFMHVVNRLFRILPSYASLLIFLRIVPLMSSGPTWNSENPLYQFAVAQKCFNNWWKHLLFINNIYDSQSQCLRYTWYLAADFQIYALAPVILIPLVRWPKLGVLLLTACAMVSPISSAFNGYYTTIPPTFFLQEVADMKNFRQYFNFYRTPLPHASCYCIGMLAAYIFIKKPDLKIPVKFQVIGWILAVVCNVSLIYGPVNWIRGVTPPLPLRVVYHSLDRTLWSLGLMWCVICCLTGHAGFVNRFLSWDVFVVFGRLTFLAYLIHPIASLLCGESLRTHITPSLLTFTWTFFAYFVVTYMVAFGSTLLIEMPFMNLKKILIVPSKKKTANLEQNGAVKKDISPLNNTDVIILKNISNSEKL